MKTGTFLLPSLLLTLSKYELDTNIWVKIPVVEGTCLPSTATPVYLVVVAVLGSVLPLARLLHAYK